MSTRGYVEPVLVLTDAGDVVDAHSTASFAVHPLLDEDGNLPEDATALADGPEPHQVVEPVGSIVLDVEESADRDRILRILEEADGLYATPDEPSSTRRLLWRVTGPVRSRGWEIVDQAAGRRARTAGQVANLYQVPAWIADRPGVDSATVEALQLVIETQASAGATVDTIRGRFTIRRLIAAPNSLEEVLDTARASADRVRGARAFALDSKQTADEAIRDAALAGVSANGIASWTGFARDTVRAALENHDNKPRTAPKTGEQK